MKTLLHHILHHRFLAVLVIFAVIGYGFYCYRTLPHDAFPDISPVMVPVFAEAPGLAPEEVERLISYPVESAMNGLPDVTLVKSTSAFGMAVVYVYFKDSVDIYFARQLVGERLNGLAETFPKNFPRPNLGPISSGLGQIFIYYLSAEKNIDTDGKPLNTYLREVNDTLVKLQLQTVTGVTSILSMGGHVLQYQIQLDPAKMAQYQITIPQIIDAVNANNRNVGGQYLVSGGEEFLIRGIGMLTNLDDIKNITLREENGRLILISDIAEVVYGNEVRRGVVLRNGEEVVTGMVLKLYGENSSQVIEALHKKIATIKNSLPQGVNLIAYYDQADLVNNATTTVENALLQGIVLVIIVLMIFLLSLRAAIIVALAMPFCAAFALIGMKHYGISANLMSLGGIAIALGMLVDGSIIVVENILRHFSIGKWDAKSEAFSFTHATPLTSHYNAEREKMVIDSANEVARPIAFALLMVSAVFLPVFLLEGVEGKMFRPLAFSVTAALIGSIFAAVICAPVLGFFFLRKPKHVKPRWEILRNVANQIYLPLLNRALHLKRWLFIGVGGALIIALIFLSQLGREFIPTLEEGAIIITVSMTPSIGLEQAEKVVRHLENGALKHPAIKSSLARIGRPELGSHPHPVNFAEIQLELIDDATQRTGAGKQKIVDELRAQLSDYPGVALNFSQPIQNAFEELLSGTRAFFAIKIYGDDLEVLQQKAEAIRAAVSNVDGVVDLTSEKNFGQGQVHIIFDRSAGARFGVSGETVMQLIENAIGGAEIGGIYQQTRRYAINLRLQENARDDMDALKNLLVQGSGDKPVRLEQICEFKLVEAPVQINRENNHRRWTITGNIKARALSEVVADMREQIAKNVPLPAGYFIEFGGQVENQERSMKRLMFIVPLVIGIIFLLLWMTFSKMRMALLVLLNVPLALIGGVIGLYVTGQFLSVPAVVGFIALFGIAMQDAVVLLSDFQDLRKGGADLRTAVMDGATIRFRSVILTTLTTLLGLLPLLLSHGIGAEVQRPLAAIVIFGLASSTLLTLFVLPVLYHTIEKRLANS